MSQLFIRRLQLAGLAFCVWMIAPEAVLRADTTGTILGTVRDSSGAAMPNVTITETRLGKPLTRIPQAITVSWRFP